MKTPLLLISLIVILSCGVDKRTQTEKLITGFEKEFVDDHRETVFDVRASFEKGKVVLKGEISKPDLKEALIRELQAVGVRDEITLLPDSSVGQNSFALVTLPLANMRAAPRHSSELVTQALLGTPVRLLQKEKGWYRIQTPDNYISWVDAPGVVPLTHEELNEWQNSDRFIFTGDMGTIYETRYLRNPVSPVPMGGILQVTEQTQNVLTMIFPDGRRGHTLRRNWTGFSTFAEEAVPDSTSLVELAQQFTGRPYLWGGTSAIAMDCSGFTKTIYFMHGIILARDASLQVRQGQSIDTSVSRDNVRPGDLLFFGHQNSDQSAPKITHVALSLGGPKFIHASGIIRENSLDPQSPVYSAYREKTFVEARRIRDPENGQRILRIQNHPWYVTP